MSNKLEEKMKIAQCIIDCAFVITKVLEENTLTGQEMDVIIQRHTKKDGEIDWNAVSEYTENYYSDAIDKAIDKAIINTRKNTK
jgi:hypothetical protein